MQFQILPILKALAPLVAEAGGIVAGLRSSGKTAGVSERVTRLEQETLRAGEVIVGIARQLEAVAVQLRTQTELVRVQQRRTRVTLGFSIAALVVALAAVALATWRTVGS